MLLKRTIADKRIELKKRSLCLLTNDQGSAKLRLQANRSWDTTRKGFIMERLENLKIYKKSNTICATFEPGDGRMYAMVATQVSGWFGARMGGPTMLVLHIDGEWTGQFFAENLDLYHESLVEEHFARGKLSKSHVLMTTAMLNAVMGKNKDYVRDYVRDCMGRANAGG